VRNLLPLFVAIPLAGGFLMPVVGRLLGPRRRACALIPILLAAGVLALAVRLVLLPDAQTPPYWMGAWDFPVGISLVADGLSKFIVLIVAVVSLAALLFSTDYMTRYTSPGLYYGLFLLMLAGMNGVVLAGDLFNVFVFLEVAGIASYALVAFGTEADELEASFKYLILGSIASAFVLVAVAILYSVTGHLNLAKIAEVLRAGGGLTVPIYLAAAFLLMGFALKAALVPFHAWLPDAHPSAPAPISAMLSGVLIKACGVYVLVRLVFSVFAGLEAFGVVLVVLGTLSMVAGAILAIGQGDLKRLLAYSSISQVGYVVTAIGTGLVLLAWAPGKPALQALAVLAIFGGLFHLANHAVFKSLLFLLSGSIEYATGTRQLKSLGGLGRSMPLTAWSLRIAALSISGVPPFAGFFSKFIILLVLVQAAVLGHGAFWLVAVLALAVAVLTLVYYAKVQRAVLGGAPTAATADAREVPFSMAVATAALAVLCLAGALVLHPAVKRRIVDPAVAVLVARGLPRSEGSLLQGLPQTEQPEVAAARALEHPNPTLDASDAEVIP